MPPAWQPVNERSDLGYEEAEDDPTTLVLGAPPPPRGEMGVVQLLVEQIETADVLVMNKADRTDEAGMMRLSRTLSALNGFAALVPAEYGKVPLEPILVRKCAPRLPDDAARHVVGFWTPPGGYYMC